jgi:GNAT superfamily N-acetyltransferase
MSHLLDRSIWHALTTRQAGFGEGDTAARRYNAAFAPFAATADDSPASLRALAALLPPSARAALFTTEPLDFPASLTCDRRAEAAQMLHTTPILPPALPPGTRPLTAADIPAMLALVEITHPGPFSPRTIELGDYIGVFDGDTLLAMAGERIAPPGYVELSAICTHPDARGRGLAAALTLNLAARAQARGETPFLHVFADNTVARALYAKLGFSLRSMLHLAVVRPAA